MTDRPTPEQIARWPECVRNGPTLLDNLRAYGYMIVHPDDVPTRSTGSGSYYPNRQEAWRQGWDDCWKHIFGEAT